ncbi:unnamed protein product [Fraxinus pennsylvanica]|uniref:Formin-like protein n=1 Tax=Fraxinus pennsylvanica TaxID=56036 RepID=A0AAD1YZT3_9LAMI|nr:unnamed protein product [Fraxinus pennsylvanica]
MESKGEEVEPLLAHLIYSGEINQEMAELFWIHCRPELMHAQKALDRELYLTEEWSSYSKELLNSKSSTKEDIHKTVSVLQPQVSQILLDCLMEKKITFLISGEEKGVKNWYTRYLGFFFSRPDPSIRRELIQKFGEAPASSPNPAPSIPIAPDVQRPDRPPLRPFFPPEIVSNLPPTAGKQSTVDPNSASGVQSDKKKSNKKTIVIAVVVTAGVTLALSVLLFLFYRRFCGAGSAQGRNDERPLLSLSLSDYSIASSPQSFGLATSINGEKLGNLSTNKSNHNKSGHSFYVESHSLSDSKIELPVVTIAGAADNPVKYSSGMSPGVFDTPGLPPLKPPPGRTDPPKPPPGPGNTSAPAAPSPVPPSPLNPFGGPRPHPPGPPPPPPIPSGSNTGPRPPPLPPRGGPPPRPPSIGSKPPRPSPPGQIQPSTTTSTDKQEATGSKTKLKPFFWDKVLANPDQSMVWNQIKSGSFQFNEEMIESLFGYAPAEKNKNVFKKDSSSQDPSTQHIQIIDPKKSQNLSILLKALNVTTEEVCDALQEGNELPTELMQNLLKMAPTSDEELKLRLYSGELSQLGPADRFLKVLVDIPFAFKRLESLLFMFTLQEDTAMVKESFAILEAACTELRKSRLFLKLLEAVLKTGNRMNDGTFRGGAQAFKLDTLLKLSDVKGTDGKTTLLHFVVQEIIRSEGVRAARAAKQSQITSSIKSDDLPEDSYHDSDEHYSSIGLQIVSGLGGELENARRAAILDADGLAGMVAKLGQSIAKARGFLNSEMNNTAEENGFRRTLKSFVQNAEVDVAWLLEEERRIMAVVKSTADYFHGNAGKEEGLRLFVIVRDFLIILDKVCREVKNAPIKPNRTPRKEELATTSTAARKNPPIDPRQRLFPAITDRRMDSSSSDDD